MKSCVRDRSEMPALREALAMAVACPDCHSPLTVAASHLRCEDCDRDFPIDAAGTVRLLSSRSEFFRQMADAPATETVEYPATTRGRFHDRLLPRTTPYQLTRRHWETAVHQCPQEGIIVNLGSGPRTDRVNDRWINVDVTSDWGCDVVADAHYLPFLGDSVAAILSSNVFEYVRNPFRVAAEIKRVLRPGGFVFVNVALLFPLTAPFYPDRFRYTAQGLHSLFEGLEIVAVGPSSGPMMGLAKVLDMAVDAIVPTRVLAFACRLAVGWVLQPLKYLDPPILRRPGGNAAATSFFLLARKRHPGPTGGGVPS